ncbi:MAG TPA: UDP-N-acetylmuramoyl-tripeptide--D-alanyl-D-alanine ligase [Chitinophagales bacterium]|nr:UDP-N-acetylmuramoyl-tripeptide--D-alanyl-D-alanine ligase [Chitinophagales bacterium]HNJ89399.1 UDP-N-acetylmuramoyl-tripeptide--D-alanyl-D-alanine ligase [Chitinophagales bacterium]
MITELYSRFSHAKGVTIDNRTISGGEMFFGLRGEKVNGGMFAGEALQKGASCCVVDDAQYATDSNIILVPDALLAMQELAAHYRSKWQFPVLALTGSNGKTTTKELIAAVLSKKYRTYATKGNLNNHIGVPLTILNIGADCEFAVIEMGANHQGEIASYCKYADPDFGLITNIGLAHLEGFGGIEGVAKGKSELYQYIIKKDGVIFWNSNQERLTDIAKTYARTVRYGTNPEDYTIGIIDETATMATVVIDDEIKISSHLVGAYNADNIIAAACIGKYFDVSYGEIQEAVENYIPANNRSEHREINGNYFILDAYNANPSSMRVALENFAKISAQKKVIIIGDMLELGTYSADEHKQILDIALHSKFDHIVTVGPQFHHIRRDPVIACHNSDEARQWFLAQQFREATILLKGSRGMKLEKIIQ